VAESDKQDLGHFVRDLMTRLEKTNDAVIRRLDAQTDQLRELTRQTRDHTEEMRAQREGFLALIDEMRGAEGGA
jgi:hypothetical protein